MNLWYIRKCSTYNLITYENINQIIFVTLGEKQLIMEVEIKLFYNYLINIDKYTLKNYKLPK